MLIYPIKYILKIYWIAHYCCYYLKIYAPEKQILQSIRQAHTHKTILSEVEYN